MYFVSYLCLSVLLTYILTALVGIGLNNVLKYQLQFLLFPIFFDALTHILQTSPYLWYFYSALPRSLAFSIFLVPIGFYLDRRLKNILFPALGFVWMFSNLPHKELRFIIYTVPLFNTAAAVACNRL